MINNNIREIMESTIAGAASISAVFGDYIRYLMCHKFTGMPKRSFTRQIMRSYELLPVEEWLKLGVDPKDFDTAEGDPDPARVVSVWWASDAPFYEIAERRLAREDFERRLAARQVPRYEWELHSRLVRQRKKNPEPPGRTSDDLEQVGYRIMGELLEVILATKQQE